MVVGTLCRKSRSCRKAWPFTSLPGVIQVLTAAYVHARTHFLDSNWLGIPLCGLCRTRCLFRFCIALHSTSVWALQHGVNSRVATSHAKLTHCRAARICAEDSVSKHPIRPVYPPLRALGDCACFFICSDQIGVGCRD